MRKQKKIFEIGNKYNLPIMLFSIEKCYVWRCDNDEFERQKKLDEILTPMEDLNINFIKEKKIPITKFVFINDMKRKLVNESFS